LVPAVTGSGESVLVTDKSADVATVVVAVLETTVPFATLALTLTTSVKTADPSGTDDALQLTVPLALTAGVVQLQPPGELRDTNVVPTGSASLSDTVCAVDGPLLVAVIVYVRSVPAVTGSGLSVLVTDKSADVATVVLAVAELLPVFGSNVDEFAEAVLEITVPLGVPAPTFTTRVKTADPGANEEFVAVTVPVAPTAGVVANHPDAVLNETNVVLGGTASVSWALVALFGPLLATVIV
jgi:hypothetical protein